MRYVASKMVVLLVLAVLGIGAGCEFKGGEAQRVRPDDAWQPHPVSMRVYPSTRFAMRDGDAMLEARIELLDQMDDPIKGVGVFVLELLAPQRGGGPTTGRRLDAWRVPMLTLERQRQFFDPITRTYLLRLKLDDPAASERATVLHVTFAPIGQPRLEAHAELGDWGLGIRD